MQMHEEVLLQFYCWLTFIFSPWYQTLLGVEELLCLGLESPQSIFQKTPIDPLLIIFRLATRSFVSILPVENEKIDAPQNMSSCISNFCDL